jgi:nicotinate-nucleotide adenylyltransferase
LQIEAPPTFAVFGGSFNPLHEGHVAIVRALAGDAELAGVIVVPARRSPFKGGAELLPAELRWSMLRHALGGMARVSLSDAELRRPAPSYTVETLRTLAAQLPAARLAFALGGDAFADFARWQGAAELLALAGLIVFDRAGEGRAAPPGPADWARLLPPPWDARARPLGTDRLADEGGRVLLRHRPLALPAVAAREILGGQTLEGVPAGAREVLAAYWRQAGRG